MLHSAMFSGGEARLCDVRHRSPSRSASRSCPFRRDPQAELQRRCAAFKGRSVLLQKPFVCAYSVCWASRGLPDAGLRAARGRRLRHEDLALAALRLHARGRALAEGVACSPSGAPSWSGEGPGADRAFWMCVVAENTLIS